MILSAIINVLLLSHYFKPVHLLRLNVKPSEMILQSSHLIALKQTFIMLRESRQYEDIQALLELETFDIKTSYIESCTTMTDEDYKAIIEHFYSKNEMERLSKILSPDCVMSMSRSYFHDSVMACSFRDLPTSLLAVDTKSFCFRSKSFKYAYYTIVMNALDKRHTNINWDNLVRSPRVVVSSQRYLSLREAFDTSSTPTHFKTELFYYLSYSMLNECNFGDDILWLVQTVLPSETVPLPSSAAIKSSYIEPKILSSWNEQLFRVVSSISFHFELDEFKRIGRNSRLGFWDKIEEAKELLSQTLNRFNDIVTKILAFNTSCEPFKQILSTISAVYSIFMSETFSSNAFINQTYRNIVKTFSLRAGKQVQGDWLNNLFFIFWKRKFRALKLDGISESIRVFFSRNPTIYSIIRVYNLYVSAFNYLSPYGPIPVTFEGLIPSNRLKEVYEKAPWILVTRFDEVSFDIRWKMNLIQSRKKICENNFGNFHIRTIKELPTLQADQAEYKRELIENFKLTVRALNNFDANLVPIRIFSTFKFIGNNFIRKVGIRECIEQFFRLILEIPDFRIITAVQHEGHRPVIIITPLLSKEVGNILGQTLAISTILNIPIPFSIDKSQLESIFKGDLHVNPKLLLKIKNFCNQPAYINLLAFNQGVSRHFWITTERFFKLFTSWSNLFPKSHVNIHYQENLIEESFTEFNTRIFLGFKQHYSSSKFSFEELVKILS